MGEENQPTNHRSLALAGPILTIDRAHSGLQKPAALKNLLNICGIFSLLIDFL
jgi:hypothetical protein